MTEQIEGLLRILDRLLLKYTGLLEVARGLQDALIKNDLTAFEEFLKKEHLLLSEVGKLEEERLSALQGLASRFSVSPEELSVSNLASMVPGEFKPPLTEFQAAMAQVLTGLKEVNACNADLLQQAVEYITFSFNVITGLNSQHNYSGSGEEQNINPERAKIFDRKI
ncbi:MAG: flagellar protein FlgN [Bacillota bacterium]